MLNILNVNIYQNKIVKGYQFSEDELIKALVSYLVANDQIEANKDYHLNIDEIELDD